MQYAWCARERENGATEENSKSRQGTDAEQCNFRPPRRRTLTIHRCTRRPYVALQLRRRHAMVKDAARCEPPLPRDGIAERPTAGGRCALRLGRLMGFSSRAPRIHPPLVAFRMGPRVAVLCWPSLPCATRVSPGRCLASLFHWLAALSALSSSCGGRRRTAHANVAAAAQKPPPLPLPLPSVPRRHASGRTTAASEVRHPPHSSHSLPLPPPAALALLPCPSSRRPPSE